MSFVKWPTPQKKVIIGCVFLILIVSEYKTPVFEAQIYSQLFKKNDSVKADLGVEIGSRSAQAGDLVAMKCA